MPVGSAKVDAKVDANQCNESPLRGENPDFWPVSKNNTGSLPLRGNPAGRIVRRIKARKKFRNQSRESPLRGDSLPKSGNF